VIDAKARYRSKISIFAPVTGSLSEYCHNVWHGKTRMVWLPDGDKILKICLFIRKNTWTWQTDRQTPHESIALHSKNQKAHKKTNPNTYTGPSYKKMQNTQNSITEPTAISVSVHNCAHNTADNISESLSSHPSDNHHSSGAVFQTIFLHRLTVQSVHEKTKPTTF